MDDLSTRTSPLHDDILVVGIGNENRGDDALGPIAARRMQALNLEGVTVCENPGDGAALIEMWRGRRGIVLIDAISSGCSPGLIHRIDASITRITPDLFRRSSHSFGVAEAVELSRKLGFLPKRFLLFGIEGKSFRIGAPLSPPVAGRIDDLIEAIAIAIYEMKKELSGQHVV